MKETTTRHRVTLCVTGGVAAYKAADIARRLLDMRLDVKVMMTANAERFVTPLTFEALTGTPVIRASQWPEPGEGPMPHIDIARESKLILVAPATANIISKFANGVADDMMTTTLLASTGNVLMAPAMNTNMYLQPQIQSNIARLKKDGVSFIGPISGELACGVEGVGKLASVEEILHAVKERLNLSYDLAGKKIIVTAGGGREPIDAVRFIGNRSSGKMGIAIARQAFLRGADVTLIAAHCDVPLPEDFTVVRAMTAEETLKEVRERFGDCDILIMAQAVGDYRVMRAPDCKVRTEERMTLELESNPDILAQMGKIKEARILVGFAAQTHNLIPYGREKLKRKNLDMIVINDVSRSDIGFGSESNEVTVLKADGEEITFAKERKDVVAVKLLDLIKSEIDRRIDA